MRDDEIHVGDVLRVRSWEDMAEELGVDADGDIIPPEGYSSWFAADMRYMCGSVFTVRSIGKSGELSNGRYHSEECLEEGWHIRSYMLEPLEAHEEELKEPGDSSGLFSFLLSK